MTTGSDETFRFFDNREKYLLFATTCSEKRETAKRVGRELDRLSPRPPAFRVFQTGSGEGTILNLLLRQLHFRWPDVPFLVVVREKNPEFIRMALDSLADRFREHPALVVVVTNLGYRDLARGGLAGPGGAAPLMWRELALTGTTAQAFDAQINGELGFINEAWEKRSSAETGLPVSAHPAAFVLYRADRRFALDRVVPAQGDGCPAFDLIVASHPYRARLPAAVKARMVLAPLAARLAPGGRLIAIQATGDDPGMEIIREVWPEEAPFATPRGALLQAIERELGDARPDLACIDPAEPEFRYCLQLNPNDVDSNIGTSTLLAAWNAATYVAQIDDARLTRAMSEGAYLDGTRKVLAAHQGLWFNNECLLVTRAGEGETPL
jgi:hypothetical protein